MEDIKSINGGDDLFNAGGGSPGKFNADAAMCYFASSMAACFQVNQSSNLLMDEEGRIADANQNAFSELGDDAYKKNHAIPLAEKAEQILKSNPLLDSGGPFASFASAAVGTALVVDLRQKINEFKEGFLWGFMYDSRNAEGYLSDGCYAYKGWTHEHADVWMNQGTGVSNRWTSNYTNNRDGSGSEFCKGNSGDIGVNGLTVQGDGAKSGTVFYGAGNCIEDGLANVVNTDNSVASGFSDPDLKAKFSSVGDGFFGGLLQKARNHSLDPDSKYSDTERWLCGAGSDGWGSAFSGIMADRSPNSLGNWITDLYKNTQCLVNGETATVNWCPSFAMVVNMLRLDSSGNGHTSKVRGIYWGDSEAYIYQQLGFGSTDRVSWSHRDSSTNEADANHLMDRLTDSTVMANALNYIIGVPSTKGATIDNAINSTFYDNAPDHSANWDRWDPRTKYATGLGINYSEGALFSGGTYSGNQDDLYSPSSSGAAAVSLNSKEAGKSTDGLVKTLATKDDSIEKLGSDDNQEAQVHYTQGSNNLQSSGYYDGQKFANSEALDSLFDTFSTSANANYSLIGA